MEKEKCSFCRKSIPNGEPVIGSGSGVSNKRICSKCVKIASALIKNKSSRKIINISEHKNA